jgi:chorismate mutase
LIPYPVKEGGVHSLLKNNFDLAKISALLEGLEETIIFKLIDRAQFSHNPRVYQKGKSGFKGSHTESLFSLRLLHQEGMDALFGRFCVPEERPYNAGLPASRRKLAIPPTGLALDDVNRVNLTAKILAGYLGLVPLMCRHGDDGHYGSSVEHDVYAFQAIARRVHYGSLYVAESKFRSDSQRYGAMILAKDALGILSLLTRRDVEKTILARIRKKVAVTQARVNHEIRHVIDPGILLAFYRDFIIPLTKEGEVTYLLNRAVR